MMDQIHSGHMVKLFHCIDGNIIECKLLGKKNRSQKLRADHIFKIAKLRSKFSCIKV